MTEIKSYCLPVDKMVIFLASLGMFIVVRSHLLWSRMLFSFYLEYQNVTVNRDEYLSTCKFYLCYYYTLFKNVGFAQRLWRRQFIMFLWKTWLVLSTMVKSAQNYPKRSQMKLKWNWKVKKVSSSTNAIWVKQGILVTLYTVAQTTTCEVLFYHCKK